MAHIKVYNKGMNPIEVGGQIWPARETLSVNLKKGQVDIIKKHPKLVIEGEEANQNEPEEEEASESSDEG